MLKLKNEIMTILFDGVCSLCQSSIRYVLRNDKEKKFKFTPIQGEFAKTKLKQNEINTLDSIVLFDDKKVYYKSNAVLKICVILGGWHKLFYIGYLVPKKLRDWAYELIAKKRYSWFGKHDRCMIPDKKIKSRFLD